MLGVESIYKAEEHGHREPLTGGGASGHASDGPSEVPFAEGSDGPRCTVNPCNTPLDPSSGPLAYANAGHDLPHMWAGGDAEELRARGMPLGLMPDMGYEEKEAVLETGDSILFYSDGLVEAHDPRGEMFGFPRLPGLVSEHANDRSLLDFLMEELYAFTGETWEQEDDITLLTLRRTTKDTKVQKRNHFYEL